VIKLNLEGCKALVTGGSGFVGSYLSEALLDKGCKVRIIDNLSTGFIENINHLLELNSVEFIKGDISDIEVCLKAVKDVDLVFHQAAQINPVRAVEEPLFDFDVNAKGTLNLLEACRRKDIKKFIFASTNVYGNPKYLPIDENHPIDLLSPYAASKLSGEAYCIVYHNAYGIETTRLRNTNIYGPRQRSTKSESGVITIFIERILKSLPPIIFGDGEQTRDFIYVSDTVQGNILAAESEKSKGEVFNIGYGKETSINALAKYILKIAGKEDLTPVYQSGRAADFRRCIADIRKARDVLNFSPKVNFENGLKKTINWWKQK
jgi:nucleoside-diphosphate-sugar epimerase